MIEIKTYKTKNGVEPIVEWLGSIKDIKTKSIILQGLTKLQTGLIGNVKPIGEGVKEYKIYHGSGYRVYFGNHNNEIIILLCGGDKGTQKFDIIKAKRYWADYQSLHKKEKDNEKHKRSDRGRAKKKRTT